MRPERRRSAGARQGEFERLYLKSYGLVYNYVRFRMDDDAAAEDVVAEAFLKAARSFDSFDPNRAKFSTWVTAIAKNCMISYYRKERPTVALEDVSEAEWALADHQTEVEDADLVKRLLATLDGEERELIVRKYQAGLSNKEIAAELDMNPSTVSTKVARILSKLRNTVEGE